MSRRVLRLVVAAVVVCAVAVVVTVLVVRPTSVPEPSGGPATTLAPLPDVQAEPDPAQAAFAGQRLAWGPCPGDGDGDGDGDGGGGAGAGGDDSAVDCAGLAVPVDWDAPDGPRIELALARRAAPAATRTGALVVNPGGPGASGVAWVRGAPVVTPAVAERFDVVGFDPRGAGASAPVECLDDAGMDAYLAGEGARAAAGASDESEGTGEGAVPGAPDALAAGCAARGGPLLAHVDVASIARDLDVLRDALGEEHLDYLGKSWGTLLGATHADLFPERVGRVVLDGALDPALDADAVALDQARGLEGALRAWAADCPDRSSCRLPGDDAGARAALVGDLLDDVAEDPLPVGDRALTAPLALTGVIAPLYDQRAWPVLDAALLDATGGDGAALLASADAYVGRGSDGAYATNLIQAFTATTCLDTDVERAPDADEPPLAALERAAPVLGRHLVAGSSTCEGWPVAGVRTPAPLDAAGAAPILVVGTTGDPATPYGWARSLAEQIDRARLLTYDGQGHTAYGRGSACIDAAVEGYLLDGVVPGEGATCT